MKIYVWIFFKYKGRIILHVAQCFLHPQRNNFNFSCGGPFQRMRRCCSSGVKFPEVRLRFLAPPGLKIVFSCLIIQIMGEYEFFTTLLSF